MADPEDAPPTPGPTSLAVQLDMQSVMQQFCDQCDFIFVGGAARSGTTLVKHLLDSHTNICCGHEMKLIPMMCSTHKLWWKNMQHQLVLAGMSYEHYDDSWRAFVAMYMMHSRVGNKRRIAEKTPHNVTEFATLHRWFPRAKFIHVVRDGRAVAASLLKQNWIDMTDPTGGKVWYCRDATGAGRYWRHILEHAQQQQAHIPDSHYFTLRYEALVADPQAALSALFDFLGEEWQPAILQAHPVTDVAVSTWQQELTAGQVSEVEAMANELLCQHGYLDRSEA